MKYIVIEIQKNAEGNISTIITTYDDERAAISKFHTVLAAAAVSGLPLHGCTMMLETGAPLRYEHYENVQPEEGEE